jgi:hypothetical protein
MLQHLEFDPAVLGSIGVVPYIVDEVTGDLAKRRTLIGERSKGLNLFPGLEVLDRGGVQNTRRVLEDALNALEEPREATSS